MTWERSDLPLTNRSIPELKAIFNDPRNVPAAVGLLEEEMMAMNMLGFLKREGGNWVINTIPVFIYGPEDCNALRDYAFNLLEGQPDDEDDN